MFDEHKKILELHEVLRNAVVLGAFWTMGSPMLLALLGTDWRYLAAARLVLGAGSPVQAAAAGDVAEHPVQHHHGAAVALCRRLRVSRATAPATAALRGRG